MAFDIDNPTGTGTDAELLEFARAAIATVLLHGQEYTIRGRTYTRADLPELRAMVTWLESRVSQTSGPAINYAARQRPA